MSDIREEVALCQFTRTLIRKKVKQLTRRSEFTISDREDLEQRLTLHLWQRAEKYDRESGHVNVFITTVVERFVASIVRTATSPLHTRRVSRTSTVNLARARANHDRESRMTSDILRFPTGAQRSNDAAGERYDLISPAGMRRLAETYAEGAAKYGERNWEKGMPVSVCVNRALRHIFRYLDGYCDEDELAHAAWNLFAVMHFEESMPEFVDIPTRPEF